jgi:putative membrane protein insertion efficiency factor
VVGATVAQWVAACFRSGGYRAVSVAQGSPTGAFRSVGGKCARAVIYLIELYRNMVSPLRPPCCRFMPSCSKYAVDALSEYGVIRGGWLAVARLAKCGPWHQGGWDPIPERRDCRVDVDVPSGAVRDHPAKQGERGSFV